MEPLTCVRHGGWACEKNSWNDIDYIISSLWKHMSSDWLMLYLSTFVYIISIFQH